MINQSISQTQISYLGESNETTEPQSNAAPLEQNVKNLECDGVVYKVVKEDASKQTRQPYPISPSRKAI